MRAIAGFLIAATIALAPVLAFAGSDNPGVSQLLYPYSKARPSLMEPQLSQSSERATCVRNCGQELAACGQSDACQAAWKRCVAACPQ
jgi:hypothetical protein